MVTLGETRYSKSSEIKKKIRETSNFKCISDIGHSKITEYLKLDDV